MFCGQCGRQIPDGSRFCNFCGAAVTPVSGNPDQVRTETVPGPKTGTDTGLHGFETLPYNKHGYDRETGNAQHTQVPRGGFVQQGYGQQTAVGQSGQWQQNTYGQNSWQQPPQDQPWQQGFTVRTSKHRKKWLLPVIIGAAVLLLGLAAVLLFCCGDSDGKASGLGNDPALQANMSNQGVCCQIGEDYYISVPDSGIYRAKRGHMEWTIQETPECVVESQDKGNGYELFRYLVPVGNRVYYQAVWSDGEWDRFAYRVYDTVQNRDYELFTVDGDHYFCFTLNLIDDRLYYCVEGVLYYIDTTVSPEQGEACRKQTAIRIDEDADIMSCAEGFLVPEEGTLGLKLISPDNQTIRTYQNLKDMVVYVYMIRDGYAYYRTDTLRDSFTFYKMDLQTGESSVFITQSDLGEPDTLRLNADAAWFYFGLGYKNEAGEYEYKILRVDGNGKVSDRATLEERGEDKGLVCMTITGDLLVVRYMGIPDLPMAVYSLPDLHRYQ